MIGHSRVDYFKKNFRIMWKTTKNHKGMTGKSHSEKTTTKMSKSHSGKKMSEKAKVKMSESKSGHEVSKNTREKIGQARLGKKASEKTRAKLSGKNHWNWKGGISEERDKIRISVEFRLWREAVFARDNWTCQKCDKALKIKLNAHHIKNFAEYPKLRFAIDNGITFCEKCHKKFHKQFGYSNNNKKQLKEFLR